MVLVVDSFVIGWLLVDSSVVGCLLVDWVLD